MSNIFQVGKTYDPSEVLTLLAADVDSDEEDFDENNFITTEQENSSEDDECVAKRCCWLAYKRC